MREQIKSHIEEHKLKYACVITGLIGAGITYAIMRSSILRGGMRVEGLQGGPSNTASLTFLSPQTINITTVLDREGRGHPGWPVRNLETKHVFLSQKEAADAFGISESLMSGHIKGKFPDVDGLHFERINLTQL